MDNLRAALESHLNTLTNVLPTEYELVAFTPQNDVPYQSAYLSDIIANDMSIAFDGKKQFLGFFQITLRYPTGQGSGALTTEALRIIGHFKRGTVISKNDIKVKINKTPTRSKVTIRDDRGLIAVRVSFEAYNIV